MPLPDFRRTQIKEITAGIYQLNVPIPNNPLGDLNAYLIRGTAGWLLVDTGWNCSEAFEAFQREVEEVGVSLQSITGIVVTHVHPDHYGLMGRIKRSCGARTAFHQRAADVIGEIAKSTQERVVRVAQQLRECGMPEGEVAVVGGGFKAVRNTLHDLDLPDVVLQGGERITTGIFNFEVILTPGHAPGHICLYEPERKILLAGDHLLPKITPSVSMVPYFDDNPLGAYLDSLREVNKLDVDLVLPGHEEVFEGLQRRVSEIIAHHKDRLDHALKAIKHEAKTAYNVAAEMPWTVDAKLGEEVSFNALDALGRGMATGETLAHLEYLIDKERVTKESRDGVILYKAS
jgi:glyoxylase-like metal-dependent hydrolase (beta-lactamase superfamily II)